MNPAAGSTPSTTHLIGGLKSFDTLVELHASDFYRERRREIGQLLESPLVGASRTRSPQVPESLRVVQWNIEKGVRFAEILTELRDNPALRDADVYMLNEVDLGMARSGNRNVARDLAEELDLAWVFAPAHLELTKGVGSDLEAPGENAVGLQGNAILSRHPLVDARVIGLPTCFEPYHFHEKRFGRRVAVVATVDLQGGPLVLAGTHLEVRNTMKCRAKQVRSMLASLPPTGPALIGGDFNCSTFERGTVARTVRGTVRLLGDGDRLRESLRHAPEREPLFLELKRRGFRLEGFNTSDFTIVEQLGGLEDARHLPGPARRAILRRLDRLGRQLEMRLDWFAGRDIAPEHPRTMALGHARTRPSDHDPIAVTVRHRR